MFVGNDKQKIVDVIEEEFGENEWCVHDLQEFVETERDVSSILYEMGNTGLIEKTGKKGCEEWEREHNFWKLSRRSESNEKSGNALDKMKVRAVMKALEILDNIGD